MRTVLVLCATFFAILVARPSTASFHLMQIEQVMGGVDGNTSVQAIQLRMRQSGQGQVQQARLVARDAAGANPILLIDFTNSVPTTGVGVRVLAATSNLSSFTNPPLSPDFVLVNTIPASYLAAGTVEFIQDGAAQPVWRLSWGGSDYTGPGAGTLDNDADGNFNPPFPGLLPSTSGKALRYQFAANALSINNQNDYQFTPGPATFTRNNGTSGTLVSAVGVGGEPGALALGTPFPNPGSGSIRYGVTIPREAWVKVVVVDLAGRRVKTLVNGTLGPGHHQLDWDAGEDGVGNGVYLLLLDAEGERRSRRFALIR